MDPADGNSGTRWNLRSPTMQSQRRTCLPFGYVHCLLVAPIYLVVPTPSFAHEQSPSPDGQENQIQAPSVDHDGTMEASERKSAWLPLTLKSVSGVLLEDATYLLTSPSRLDLKSGLITTGVAGILAGVMVADPNIQKWVQSNQTRTATDFFNGVETIGNAVLPVNAALAVAGYAFRKSEQGNTLFQTSLVSLEAQGFASGITALLKFAVGRQRPFVDPQGNTFQPFRIFGGLPSGHATQMFAFAAVFAEEYPPPIQILVYTLATAVSADRVYFDRHFTSDVLAGAVIGYVVGKALASVHTVRDGKLSFLPLDIDHSIGVAVHYRF